MWYHYAMEDLIYGELKDLTTEQLWKYYEKSCDLLFWARHDFYDNEHIKQLALDDCVEAGRLLFEREK